MKHHGNGDDRRSLERVPVAATPPVYLETNLEGNDVAMVVENLSTGGATVIYPEDSAALQPGNRLEESALNLPGIGRVAVSPIVRWRLWPKVGIQFAWLDDSAKEQIAQFLQKG